MSSSTRSPRGRSQRSAWRPAVSVKSCGAKATAGERTGTIRRTSPTLISREEDQSMKVLLAVDGSPHSEAAIADTARGSWPDETAIEILSVIPARARSAVGPAFVLAAVYVDQISERRRYHT